MNPRSRLLLVVAFILIVIAVVLLMRAQRAPEPATAITPARQDQTPMPAIDEPFAATPLPDAPKRLEPPQKPTEQVPQPQQTPPPGTPAPPNPQVTTDITTLRAKLEEYKDRTGTYPTSTQGLSVLGIAMPKDPWQRDYFYQNPSTRNRVSYDLFSFGPDGMADTPDDDWGEEIEGEVPQNQ